MLPTGYTLRPATNHDRTEVSSLVNGILADYGILSESGHVDRNLMDIETSFAGGFLDLIVDNDGNIVGTIGVLRHSDSTAELTKMFLLQKERGKGLGRFMIDHALDFAKGHGFTSVFLETDTKLTEAVSLYQKYGFEIQVGNVAVKRCNTVMSLTLS